MARRELFFVYTFLFFFFLQSLLLVKSVNHKLRRVLVLQFKHKSLHFYRQNKSPDPHSRCLCLPSR